jgi:flagellar biosynthetic protein FlhB
VAFGDGDRTEAPTGRRKREARRKGNIAKSPEVSVWAEVLVASFLVPSTVAHMLEIAGTVLGELPGIGRSSGTGDALHLLRYGVTEGLLAVAPLTAAVAVTAVVANVAQTGLYVSRARLRPNLRRLNPLAGLKRLASPESVWNLGKVLLKVLVLALVAWPPTSSLVAELASAQRPELGAALTRVGAESLVIVQRVAIAGLLLAAVDYAAAQRRIRKSLKMTKREVKEEAKQSEGSPEAKAGIKKRQVQISRNRMISSVATASVVVVNPTHVAVALAYGAGQRAPKVVAKGKGAVAARIRAAAEEHHVPIVRDVPLARTLHDACEVDEEIPASLYEAVARVLAFLFSVRHRAPFGGDLVLPG